MNVQPGQSPIITFAVKENGNVITTGISIGVTAAGPTSEYQNMSVKPLQNPLSRLEKTISTS